MIRNKQYLALSLRYNAFILLALLLTSCVTSSTPGLLNLDFLGSGKNIKLLSPANGESVTANPVLVWTTSSGLSKFRVQIATESSFSNLVVDKPVRGASFSISSGDTLSGKELEPVTHYWRVSIENGGETSTSYAMEVVTARKIYVSASTASTNPAGSKTNPFKTITAAMTYADGIRNADAGTSVEILVAQGTYAERITLLPGITLRGGYNRSDWSRNVAANISLIQSPTTEAMYCGSNITLAYRSTTLVDGFTITPTPNVDNDTIAVLVENSSPTLQGNVISGNASANTFRSYGLLIGGASNPTVTQNTITSGGGTGANVVAGISISSTSNVIISSNSVSAGRGTTANGIAITAGSPVISGNTIQGGTAGSSTTNGVRISGGTATVSGNTINGGTGIATVRGIVIDSAATTTISGNSIVGGAGTTTRGLLVFSGSASTANIFDNSIQGGNNISNPVAVEVANGNTATIYRNQIYAGSASGSGATNAIQVWSATVDIYNNLIHGGLALSTGSTIGIYLATGSAIAAQVRIANNTINGGAAGIGCGGCNSIGVQLVNSAGIFSALEIRNNAIFTSGGNNRYGIYEFNAAAVDPTSVATNNIFDTPTGFYRDGETGLALTNQCGTGNFGNAGCVTVLATPAATGNISVNNAGGQLFQNHWRTTDVTTGAGSTTTLTVASCASYVNGEYLEYNLDATPRAISNCAAGIVTFSPAMSAAAVTQRTVMLWGPANSFTAKYSLQPASAAICNVAFGGINLSSLTTTDFATNARTANLAGLPCALTAPSSTTGQGWSIGAFERD